MPDPSTINSWPAFAALLVVLLSFQIPHLVSTVRTRRDTRAIRVQTENEHADAEHPNLREQLDAMHADIRAAATKADTAATQAAEVAAVAHATQAALTEHVAHADAWQVALVEDLRRRRRPLIAWRR